MILSGAGCPQLAVAARERVDATGSARKGVGHVEPLFLSIQHSMRAVCRKRELCRLISIRRKLQRDPEIACIIDDRLQRLKQAFHDASFIQRMPRY